jgi:two-component system, OmpR family, sensor kinase
MMEGVFEHALGWSRSLYWQIAVSFAVFTLGMLLVQNMLFRYLLERPDPSFLSPNAMALLVAADMQQAVVTDTSVDLDDYLRQKYAGTRQPVYVVLKDGRIGGNRREPLSDDMRRATVAMLAGGDVRTATKQMQSRAPIVTAPIQLGNELRGIVVLPRPPLESGLQATARMVSLPGALLLVTAAILVAALIFSPARRRLQALESAAERLGAGDLTARAPEHGADEIARVARAFNTMASELSARDEALRTSDRLRRQMVADVSHELKTPLTSMRGYVETLRIPDIVLSPQQRGQYLDTIERETRRLERIVKDLLDIARIENDAVALDQRYFDTSRLFRQVVERHQAEADSRGVRLATSVDDEADQLFGDPDRLEQVADNLIANAIRHAAERGGVELRAQRTSDGAAIAVSDDGEGIAAEHLPHIFDRFYKVDAARASGAAGSGLGLSIARAIVERHGGTIAVESRRGRTVFTVRLPQPAGERVQEASANL